MPSVSLVALPRAPQTIRPISAASGAHPNRFFWAPPSGLVASGPVGSPAEASGRDRAVASAGRAVASGGWVLGQSSVGRVVGQDGATLLRRKRTCRERLRDRYVHPQVERSRVIAAPVVSSSTRPQFAGTAATLASSEFGFGETDRQSGPLAFGWWWPTSGAAPTQAGTPGAGAICAARPKRRGESPPSTSSEAAANRATATTPPGGLRRSAVPAGVRVWRSDCAVQGFQGIAKPQLSPGKPRLWD